MAFSDLQTQVQQIVIDLPPAVTAQIPTLINEAIISAERRYNFRAMENSVTTVTTVGSLTLTPDTIPYFKEYRDQGPYLLRYFIKAKSFVATTGPDAALAALADINNPTEPAFLINTVNETTGEVDFQISPYPDNLSDWPDGNYRLVIPYYNYTAPLVNPGDNNWFTNYMADYIYRQAAGHAFAMDWDYQSEAFWLQEAEKRFKEAQKADKMNRLSGADELVPMWQGANQPRIRR
jgi:hypothetical protein